MNTAQNNTTQPTGSEPTAEKPVNMADLVASHYRTNLANKIQWFEASFSRKNSSAPAAAEAAANIYKTDIIQRVEWFENCFSLPKTSKLKLEQFLKGYW